LVAAVQQIADWLKKLGMSEYAQLFADHSIDDVSILRDLTDQDLKDVGVPLGHRRKMLRAIAELSGAAPAAPQPTAQAEPKPQDAAERRQLTVMFTDLVGSTALSTKLDPEDLRSVIRVYHKCVAETIARFGGFIAKYMGDGVLVYFGYPQAHEDDAERAVRAGLTLVEAVRSLTPPEPLQVRIGIGTGLVVVGDLVGSGEAQEHGVVGETPNLAARLQAAAAPGTIVIGPTTRRLLAGLFEYRDLGRIEVKGFATAVQAYEVVRPSTVESRFEALHTTGLTALVGREEESELLLRRWSRAKSNEGQVVMLSGEAGIGKSRLTAALLERLAGEPHRRLRYFCSPQHTDSALYPIIGQMERAAGLTHDDAPRMKLDKLDAVLAQTSTSIEDASLFAEMLSIPNDGRYPRLELDAQQRRQRTLEALILQLEALTRSNPVLMIFEDTQWTDPTSLEVFGRVVDRIEALRVLLIVTFRPEFDPPWIGQPHVTAMTINRLARRDVGTMIDRVVGNKMLPASVRQDIIERTDGIPLFVEEMTKTVLEAEDEGAAQRTVAAVPSPPLAVPASLHASLMARLDRLGPAKEVAQIGAAIGREFPHALLASVVRKSEAELASALNRLVEAGLLFRQGVSPQASYLFKHALVQDAAYGTLLRGKRQELHARVAAVLEQRFADVVKRQPELLAHHLTAAGETRRAIDRWLEAGKHAAQRSAHIEAIARFDRALALLPLLPEAPDRDNQEIEIQTARGLSLLVARGVGSIEVAEAYGRAIDLCEKHGGHGHLFAALWGFWLSRLSSGGKGDFATALSLSGKLLVLAQRQPEAGLRLQAHHSAWTTHFFCGAPETTLGHCQAGCRLYDMEQHRSHALLYGGHDPGVCARYTGAFVEGLLGYPAKALASIDDAVVLAERLAHPFSLELALMWATMIHHIRREPEQALRQARRAEALAAEHRLATPISPIVLQAGALAAQGDAGEALAQLRAASAGKQGPVTLFAFKPYALALLSKMQEQVGDHAAALETMAEALAASEESGARWWDAEIHRLKGMVLLSRHDPEASQACFMQSKNIAQRQNAKSLELRASTSLARLWRDQGKRTEARDLLAPVYGWFTEGFDTPDLKEAKALLEQLTD
jgi:class 3 adenylate cyclase/tetratricopeptide (TPR) repeat protein